jgi:hypothetical protein
MKKLFVLLCAAMLLPCLHAPVKAAVETAATENTVYVLAGSDFQNRDGNTYQECDQLGKALVQSIVAQIQKAGYSFFDGFMFCGDYSNGWHETDNGRGLNTLKQAVSAVVTQNTHQ